jgi:hypothetical protein
MRILTSDAQVRLMQHIQEHLPSNKAKQPFAQGCLKNLQKIPKESFPVAAVVDEAITEWRNRGGKCYHYNDIIDF